MNNTLDQALLTMGLLSSVDGKITGVDCPPVDFAFGGQFELLQNEAWCARSRSDLSVSHATPFPSLLLYCLTPRCFCSPACRQSKHPSRSHIQNAPQYVHHHWWLSFLRDVLHRAKSGSSLRRPAYHQGTHRHSVCTDQCSSCLDLHEPCCRRRCFSWPRQEFLGISRCFLLERGRPLDSFNINCYLKKK